MPHRAYISIWARGFAEPVMLDRIERFLETVPLSPNVPGFTSLVMRALGPGEAALIERDLRSRPLVASEVASLVSEYLHADCCYELEAYWDLWVYHPSRNAWQQAPQRLEIFCCGEEYDGGAYAETGHFWVQAGFEHLFVGARAQELREEREKTRENVRRVFAWMHQMEASLPLERSRLWSEGEDDFQARLEEILAVG